jgi:hypothetical protein
MPNPLIAPSFAPGAAQMAATCPHCGGPFERLRRDQRYCSPRCRYAVRDRMRHIPAGTAVEVDCVECGRSFAYQSKPSGRRRKRCFACRPPKEQQ